MEKDKFIKLLSKKLSGETLESEQVQLNHALENEVYQNLAAQMESYLSEKTDGKAAPLALIWEKIDTAETHTAVNKFDFTAPKQSVFSSTLFKAAAILLAVFGVGLVGYYLFNHNQTATLAATNEKVFKVLDDGTRIWLNKKSTLSYNKDFGKERREITLDGEAYFDVVKNTAVPLIIHAGGVDIEVKGTAFNVNAYLENSSVAVALVRGAIAVTDRKNTKNSVLLKPNDKLFFFNQSAIKGSFNITALKPELILNEASWTADTLVFNKEKLVDLVLRLEKKYDLKIEIRSEKLKERRFSGTFTTETIHQALEALKLSYPLTYTITNRLVIIKDQG
ncbi:MAG: DUF4974 domain-containing protein [Pedobacter sp.]|uniref:FecR family protein n=1 Tax=Pedobacter sp. TaxID=1411316 RepID=UPI00280914BE|nr:FecR domain-containing protein [Pedobacter sp.]MDQ8005901.1 DUF4974 domain-containing protein [Pedobacter sp.]